MIVLHIGTQKTGSSSIQHFLRENQNEFRLRKVNFVSAVRDWIDHNKLARELRGGNTEYPRLRAIVSEIEADPSHTHIISAEELFHIKAAKVLSEQLPEELKRDVKIIAYLRRPDLLMEALYKQRLKTGDIKPDPENYLENNKYELDYLSVLEAYEDCFGPDSIIARPYLRNLLADGDVVTDFISSLRIPPLENPKRSRPEDNPTFSAALSELIGFCSRNSQVKFMNVNERIARLNWENIKRSGDVYTKEQRRKIMKEREDDLNRIATKYSEELLEVFDYSDLDDQVTDVYPSAEEQVLLYRQAGRALIFGLRDFVGHE